MRIGRIVREVEVVPDTEPVAVPEPEPEPAQPTPDQGTGDETGTRAGA